MCVCVYINCDILLRACTMTVHENVDAKWPSGETRSHNFVVIRCCVTVHGFAARVRRQQYRRDTLSVLT